MYAFHFVLRLILINTNFAFRHTSIQYDACDENSWDFVGERYPLSNACGQLGQVSLSLQNSQSALCWFESLIYRSFLLSFLIRTELSGLPLFSRGSPYGMRGRPGYVSCGRHTREGNQLREECVIRCSFSNHISFFWLPFSSSFRSGTGHRVRFIAAPRQRNNLTVDFGTTHTSVSIFIPPTLLEYSVLINKS